MNTATKAQAGFEEALREVYRHLAAGRVDLAMKLLQAVLEPLDRTQP